MTVRLEVLGGQVRVLESWRAEEEEHAHLRGPLYIPSDAAIVFLLFVLPSAQRTVQQALLWSRGYIRDSNKTSPSSFRSTSHGLWSCSPSTFEFWLGNLLNVRGPGQVT